MTNNLLKTLFCETHGAFVPEPFCGRSCPRCGEEYRAKRDYEQAIREARERLADAGIPRRFRGKTLESFMATTEAQAKVLRVAQSYIWSFPESFAKGRCLTFIGNVGTGKTLLACTMIQSLIRIEFLLRIDHPHPGIIYSALYRTASEIIREIRDTWRTNASTTEVINSFARVDLLIMDEVGSNAGTDSERALLFEVLDQRYQNLRPTVTISNQGREGLTYTLSERGLDRLNDNGGLLCVFDWDSFRG
jgi:DNA replication protein DnaC